jgi:sulfate adenylyltransferase
MRLANGLVWSIPVVLPVEDAMAAHIDIGQEVALLEDERILAVMEVQEKYGYDKRREAREVYKTEEEAHPGVARLYRQGDILIGGPVWLVEWPKDQEFLDFRHTPAQTRRMFASRGWRRVVGFQTRNPIHRAHEYIQKTALEIVDGLFLHPLVGETKGDDIPADVRMQSYQSLLRDYYPPDRVVLGVFPRGDIPRSGAQELRLYPLYRRTRPRRCGQVLRHVRCASHL